MKNKGNLIDKAKVENLMKKGRTIVYYGNSVLDVTDFRHPGPDNLITEANGKDLKQDFDDQGHSRFAKSLIQKYKIGSIRDNDFEELSVFTKEQQEKYAKIDAKIDLKKAIYPQLPKLTGEEYIMLMDRPQYLDSADSLKVYENDWVDWFHQPCLDTNQKVMVPASMICFALCVYFQSQADKDAQMLDMVLNSFQYFIFGVLFWTFLEYKTHRFDLHNEHTIPDVITKENLPTFFENHHLHHMWSN